MTYLSFIVNSNTYAVPVAYISESIQHSHITRIPRMPEFVLGVMNLRGKIIPVMDTRVRMGLKTKNEEREELLTLLKERELEHRNWLLQLEEEVNLDRPITVQMDPKLCNFGKWYEAYMQELVDDNKKGNNTDNALINALKAFDEPHKMIHQIAKKADELITNGKKLEALEMIRKAEHAELEKLEQLFKNLYQAIEGQGKRDIIVIIQKDEDLFGITVDAIDSTLELKDIVKAPVPTELVSQVSVVDDRTVQILDLEAFTELAKKAAA